MIQFRLRTLKRKIKNFLRLPVTRVEVLKHAKELQSTHPYPGLCVLLDNALDHYEILPFPSTIFPKFRPQYAKHFRALYSDYYGVYWWERGAWNTGRLEYLDWLINEYKDDKTNIRKL